jgi:hypothetical protein
MTRNVRLDEIKLALTGDTDAGELSMADIFNALYNSSLNTMNVIEQAPLDTQTINNKILNAVTVATTSTPISVLDKRGLTVLIKVTSGATGGTVKFQCVDADAAEYDLGFYDLTSTSADKVLSKVLTTGNYVLHLPGDVKLPQVQIDISSVTDGTYTAWIFGGAI